MEDALVSDELLGPDWKTRYDTWFHDARPLLESREWVAASRGYPWVRHDTVPMYSLHRPLATLRVALLTSGGLSLPGQPLFDEEALEGDSSYRVIPNRAPTAWTIRHGHYDPRAALRDYNTIFPLDALYRLAEEGFIGSMAAHHYSFDGYQPNPAPFLDRTLPKILRELQADRVDAVVLVPV